MAELLKILSIILWVSTVDGCPSGVPLCIKCRYHITCVVTCVFLSLVPILYSKQVIESFSYEVFYAFIKYLYTDEVNIKPKHEIGK